MGGIGTIYIEGLGWVPSISQNTGRIVKIPRDYSIEGNYIGDDEKIEQRKYTAFSENGAIAMAKSDGLIKLIKCEEIKCRVSFSTT